MLQISITCKYRGGSFGRFGHKCGVKVYERYIEGVSNRRYMEGVSNRRYMEGVSNKVLKALTCA